MAGGLMRRASILLAVICMGTASTAFAQALRDPTRPPAANAKGVTGSTGQSGWILQSVLISPERRYAIINGEVVAVGGSIAGAKLVAVAAERVTLRTPEGLRVVHLLPDVTKLDVAESAGTEQRVTSPGAEKRSKVQRSGSFGKRNEEKDN